MINKIGTPTPPQNGVRKFADQHQNNDMERNTSMRSCQDAGVLSSVPLVMAGTLAVDMLDIEQGTHPRKIKNVRMKSKKTS